jgi:hypothetical protein
VLENARSGKRSLLGHVPDEHGRHSALLGHAREPAGDLAHLADRPGGAGEVGAVERLDRVDHAHVRALGLERGHDRLEARLGHDRDAQRVGPEPLGAQLDLGGRLLAGHVQHLAAGGGEVAERAGRDRGLADARRAAEQHDRAWDEPAAEHTVELADARGEARHVRRLDLGEHDRLERGRGRGTADAARGHGRGGRLLHQRVPLAAARAAPVPLGALVGAGRADVDGARSHAATLSTREDEFAPRAKICCSTGGGSLRRSSVSGFAIGA